MKKSTLVSIIMGASIFASNAMADVIPKINFSGTYLKVTDVCYIAENDLLRSQKRVRVAKWTDNDTESPSYTIAKYIYTPRKYKKIVPDNYDGFQEIEMSYSLTYRIDLNDDYESNNSRLTKYTIPDCK